MRRSGCRRADAARPTGHTEFPPSSSRIRRRCRFRLTTEVGALASELLGTESDLAALEGTVAQTCAGLEAVTGQSNLLRSTLVGVNTALGLVKALVPALALPEVPVALPEFECE